MPKEPGSDNSSPAAPFNRGDLCRHRLRAAQASEGTGFEAHDFLFREIAERMDERLGEVNRHFQSILVVGNHGGIAAEMVRARYGQATVVRMDLAPGLLAKGAGAPVAADEEALPFAPQSFDLVISLLSLHWVNDLPGALLQMRHVLKPDGLLLASIIGGESLKELRQSFLEAEAAIEGGVSPRVSPYLDARTAGGLLQRAGLALPMVDLDNIRVTYESAFNLMNDLRGMGEANSLGARRKTFTRRATILAMAEAYQNRFAMETGRIPATFDILYLTGWAPDESQPKPLKPGSAKASLADVLGKKDA
jgi:SAM-dependent methyltransferase